MPTTRPRKRYYRKSFGEAVAWVGEDSPAKCGSAQESEALRSICAFRVINKRPLRPFKRLLFELDDRLYVDGSWLFNLVNLLSIDTSVGVAGQSTSIESANFLVVA
jgi:hypothetical protein